MIFLINSICKHMKWSILDVVPLHVSPTMASSGGYIYRPQLPLKKPLLAKHVDTTSSIDHFMYTYTIEKQNNF